MNRLHPLDPRIELRRGQRARVVSLHALAAHLDLPEARVRGALLTMLLLPAAECGTALACTNSTPSCSTAGAPEGETPEGEGLPTETFPNVPDGPRTFPTRETEGSRHVPDVPERSDAREPPAERLARTLGDTGNLALYRRLAERYAPDDLDRLLDLTMRVPIERIRLSRGAYFMGLLNRLVSPHPYARTSSPPT